jgi:hypothetical protein
MANCPQTRLEPVLLEAASERPEADIPFGHELMPLVIRRSGVRLPEAAKPLVSLLR